MLIRKLLVYLLYYYIPVCLHELYFLSKGIYIRNHKMPNIKCLGSISIIRFNSIQLFNRYSYTLFFLALRSKVRKTDEVLAFSWGSFTPCQPCLCCLNRRCYCLFLKYCYSPRPFFQASFCQILFFYIFHYSYDFNPGVCLTLNLYFQGRNTLFRMQR